jgi:DNA segregation ATPase FtsK/SpoIIIE-like protein
VVVDEFAQFRAADAPQNSQERKGRQAVAARWQEIGRTGRAVGVHVIACTQRPDAETITPQLKAQFPGKVAFFCTDDMDSRVILDDAAAAPYAARVVEPDFGAPEAPATGEQPKEDAA